MNTNERRKAVKEIMDGAPPMVSRWKMSEHLTRELKEQHGFTHPNRPMRKHDLDWYVKGLKVDDRQGVSVTLFLKALAIADLATDHKRFGEAVKALEFVRSLLGLDLSASESGDHAEIRGLLHEAFSRDRIGTENKLSLEEPDGDDPE